MSAPAPNAAATTAAPDSQALIAKAAAQTGSANSGDAALIQRIEQQISHSAMGWLQGLSAESDSRAASERTHASSAVAEHKSAVADHAKDAPKDAGTPPALGQPAHPVVPSAHGPAPGGPAARGAAPASAAGAPPQTHKFPAAPPHRSGPPRHVATPAGVAAVMSGAANDGELTTMLNGYQPRSQQPTEMVSRITQMKGIADNFNGQLDTYVAQGGGVERAIAGAANFMGVGKDASAVWRNNPYKNIHTRLGSAMQGLSAVKSVLAIVGSVCGKIGLLLTVVGLLGMIFPPIGVAVSGIARVLNLVGLVCEGLSGLFSVFLTAMNGVVLAGQIRAGATAEEKAATAEMLMTEANQASGTIVQLAMEFGPKFMKGMLGTSKGFVNSLFRQAKARIGKLTLGLTGNVQNFAKRMLRKVGLGGARAEIDVLGRGAAVTTWKEGKLAKIWNMPAKGIDRLQDITMERWGNSKFAKTLDRIGTSSGSFAERANFAERWAKKGGEAVGGLGARSALGQRWAGAADRAEADTRKAAADLAKADAMNLADERWKREYQRRGMSDKDSNREAGERAATVGRHSDADHVANEARLAKPPTPEPEWKAGDLDKIHDSRRERWELERKVTDERKRKTELEGLATRTPAQDAELRRISNKRHIARQDSELAHRRHENLELEGRGAAAAGSRESEVHNWNDVRKEVGETVGEAAEFLHLTEEKPNWAKAEKGGRQLTKYNRGKASGASRGAGGAGTYAEIRHDAQNRDRQDFAAFVALRRPVPTTQDTARSMLSSIRRTPPVANNAVAAGATGAVAAGATSAPTTTSPATSTAATPATTTATPATTTATNGGGGTAPAPANEHKAQPQHAATPAHEEPAGDEALPYWPDIVGQFDKGLQDFGYFKKVANEFKKAQYEGRQKAVDTLGVYGRYNEYAQKRKDAAKSNAQGATETKGETQRNADHNERAGNNAGQGAQKQEQARSSSNVPAAQLPEPETRGFWGRIIGQIKRAAASAASRVFGWIQEKVSSLILKCVCNVSMGDLRDYAGALRRQQIAAHGVAGQAEGQSHQAEQSNIKLGSTAQKEAQSAADSIGECDKNITEVDAFIGDVNTFETQLRQEKVHATLFIAQVHAAYHAEQARQRTEAANAAARAQAEHTASVGGSAEPNASMPDANPAVAAPTAAAVTTGEEERRQHDQEQTETEQARLQIQAATSYVKDTAEQMNTTVETRAEDYNEQLRSAMVNRTGKDTNGQDLRRPAKEASKRFVEEFKEFVEANKREMDQTSSAQVDPASAVSIADQIIMKAGALDAHYSEALEHLDHLFEQTYNGIREGQRNMKTRVLDGDNVVGDANRGVGDTFMGAADQVAGWVRGGNSQHKPA
ncbi:hypothetical protein BH11MYX2_BH11MYX2_33040 [soil metagenome]